MLEDKSFAGVWPAGLDPATNPTAGTLSQNQAIFGGLFLLRAAADGSNAHIAGNQAASGALSADGMTLTITLRPGITFSDGTALNAAAVIWNFTRDSESSCTCAPRWQLRKQDPFTSPDPLTVVVHFRAPNASILHNFPASNVNWMASPTAFKRLGEGKFKIAPVGAGPFTVVSDTLSTKLVLKRNPSYFSKGLPYLDNLTFQSVDGDQAAYQALLAGQGDAYEGASTPPVIKQAKSNPKLTVTTQPGTAPYLVQMNTNIAPFNNKKAREALYYATDWTAIRDGIFGGEPTLVQGFTTPADLFYHQKTPGYRTYDVAKAKQLVNELGGLTVQIDTPGFYTAREVTTALQSQWKKAGIKVEMKVWQGSSLIQRLTSGKWQAALGTAGAWDPGTAAGAAFRFQSQSPFSGVKDPHLDTLLAQGIATTDATQRDKIYQEVAKYVSDNAYGLFGFAFGPTQFAVKGVSAPGLTTKIPALLVNTGVIWGEAQIDKQKP